MQSPHAAKVLHRQVCSKSVCRLYNLYLKINVPQSGHNAWISKAHHGRSPHKTHAPQQCPRQSCKWVGLLNAVAMSSMAHSAAHCRSCLYTGLSVLSVWGSSASMAKHFPICCMYSCISMSSQLHSATCCGSRDTHFPNVLQCHVSNNLTAAQETGEKGCSSI